MKFLKHLEKIDLLPGSCENHFSKNDFPTIKLNCSLCYGNCLDFELDNLTDEILCCCCLTTKDWCDLCQRRFSPNHCLYCGSQDLEIRIILEKYLEYGNFFFYASIRTRIINEIYYKCNSCSETSYDIQMMEEITP